MMRAALYHRVSTIDQRPEAAREELRQAAAVRGYTVALEIEETGSGARNDRPGLIQVMTAAQKRAIDLIICWKLDRFGRSALDILANVKVLREHRVGLLCCNQGLFVSETADSMSICMMQVMAAFAEMDRQNIRERTRLGLQAAVRRGVKLGRPQVELADPFEVQQLRDRGMGYRRIAEHLGISEWAVRCTLDEIERQKRGSAADGSVVEEPVAAQGPADSSIQVLG